MDRIEKLQAFLQQTPDDCFLNHALALEYVKLGDDDKAKTFFEKNMNHDSLYIATYYHLGKLMARKGNEQEAMKLFVVGMNVAKSANDMHTYSELQSAYDEIAY